MSSRTIYALTAGQKPVVITNHFYMRPDIKESLCTQFFFWCILDEKEGPSWSTSRSPSDALTR